MPSIIPGYEYDIFISYRQKDNKGDHWVSEFVEALKTELESTFKEEISVYFDINPHDGLLETHDVDASLKVKLKCLIIIPIISHTYCDPTSFAWEHEFKAFVEMASKDQFGLKVKLANGNVASRILPVRIHDLGKNDLQLFESAMGGVLRGIDFIYSEPGVNRPLLPGDDDKINKNKTRYRNQINKVTNAIREIVFSIKEPSDSNFPEKQNGSKPTREKSIIVLPFDNLSSDPEQEYFSDGLTEEIITDLSYIHDMLVISRSSAMTFKGSKKTIPEIAREVNVHYVLEGSVRKSGNKLRIIAQLIDAVSDTHLWAEKYDGTLDNIFDIQEKVAHSIATSLKLKITSDEKTKLMEVPISDIVSYELYLKAKKFMWTFSENGLNEAMKLINQAIQNSGNIALLYAIRAQIHWQYHNAGFKPTADMLQIANEDVQRALDIDSKCNAAYTAKGYIAYTNGDLEETIKNFRKASGAESLNMTGYMFALAGEMDLARENMLQSLQQDPLNLIILCGYSYYEIFRGNYDIAADYLLKACEFDTNNALCLYYYGLTRVYSNETEKALDAYQTMIRNDSGIFGEMAILWKAVLEKNETEFETKAMMLRDYAMRDKELSWWMADCFSLMGKPDESLFWLDNSIEQGFINDTFFTLYDPTLAPFRNDERFLSLMNKAKEKQKKFRRNIGL